MRVLRLVLAAVAATAAAGAVVVSPAKEDSDAAGIANTVSGTEKVRRTAAPVVTKEVGATVKSEVAANKRAAKQKAAKERAAKKKPAAATPTPVPKDLEAVATAEGAKEADAASLTTTKEKKEADVAAVATAEEEVIDPDAVTANATAAATATATASAAGSPEPATAEGELDEPEKPKRSLRSFDRPLVILGILAGALVATGVPLLLCFYCGCARCYLCGRAPEEDDDAWSASGGSVHSSKRRSLDCSGMLEPELDSTGRVSRRNSAASWGLPSALGNSDSDSDSESEVDLEDVLQSRVPPAPLSPPPSYPRALSR